MSHTHEDAPDDPDDEGTSLQIEDAVVVPSTKECLWSFISDPEVLAQCVPGADDIEQVTDRKYTVAVTRGINHLTISLSGEVNLVEMQEPDWVVASGTAHDPKTHSDFRMLAAMEMEAVDESSVRLVYSIDVSFTGGVASLPNRMLRSILESDIDTYFHNVHQQVIVADEPS